MRLAIASAETNQRTVRVARASPVAKAPRLSAASRDLVILWSSARSLRRMSTLGPSGSCTPF